MKREAARFIKEIAAAVVPSYSSSVQPFEAVPPGILKDEDGWSLPAQKGNPAHLARTRFTGSETEGREGGAKSHNELTSLHVEGHAGQEVVNTNVS